MSFSVLPIDDRAEGFSRHGRFSWRSHGTASGRCRLRLSGELDLADFAELSRLLDTCEEASHLTVDLADLEFIDCAALACLFRAADARWRAGGLLTLVGVHGQVARLLDLTGIPPGAERLVDSPRIRLMPPAAPGSARPVLSAAPRHAL